MLQIVLYTLGYCIREQGALYSLPDRQIGHEKLTDRDLQFGHDLLFDRDLLYDHGLLFCRDTGTRGQGLSGPRKKFNNYGKSNI